MKALILASLLLASGCGDSITVDAPDETPLTLTLKHPPLLVAYREAAEVEWKPAERVDPTTFQFFARGPYWLTVVCRQSEYHLWVQQIAQTPDDRGSPAWCEHDKGPNRLTGRSIQAADIFVGNRHDYSWETEPFEFWLPSGTYDVIAEEGGRMAIRRGIEVEGDTIINNPIDLMTEGALLLPTVFTVANPLPSERYAIFITLRSEYGYFWDTSSELDKVLVVPNSVLQPADVQSVTVFGRGRRVRRKYREGDSTTFTLPDRLDPVTFTQTGNTVTATWSTLPEHDLLRYGASGISIDPSLFVIYEATITRSFEASVGITAVAPDTGIPGYQPEWHLDLTKEYFQDLEVERQVGDDTLIAADGVSVNVPPMETAGRLPERPGLLLGARHGLLP